jgi:lysophospholipase L1-like esterase
VRRTLALLLGTVVALLGLEAVLWILSLCVARAERGAQGAGAVSVLCVGDSNTYGIRLAAADTYPGQLQAFLAESGQQVSIVNHGYPGENSAEVRARLAASLERLTPSAVVAWAGINDRWSGAEAAEWTGEERGFLAELLAQSRVARLVRILAASGDLEESISVPAERLGDGRFEAAQPGDMQDRGSPATQASIRANLESMADLCRARGIPLVLATYPLFSNEIRSDVNGTIRAVALERGLALADLEPRFHELVGTVGREHLYLPRDTHLSAVGNHEAARQVLLALAERGVVRAEPPPPALEECYGGVRLELGRAGSEVVVSLTGPAEWRFHLDLCGVYAALARPGGELRVHEEPAFAGVPAEELKRWRGRFDAAGRATAELSLPPLPAHERWSAWELVAVATLPQGGPRDVRFSAPAALPARE